MTGLLLGGVEPARLPSSLITNLMAAYLGARGAVDLPDMLPDLPMSPSGRMGHGRQLEFTLGARRILGQQSATSGMPRVAPTLLMPPPHGITAPEVARLQQLSSGLQVSNAEVRRILGVNMRQGTPEQTWQAIQSRVSQGATDPQLSEHAEALVRQKAEIIRAWARHENLVFRNEADQRAKEEELLGKIWKWLLRELQLTDDGTGFITP